MVAQAFPLADYIVTLIRQTSAYRAYRLTRPDGKKTYEVVIDRAGVFCSCPHFTYRRVCCKHILHVQEDFAMETLPVTVEPQSNGGMQTNQPWEGMERLVAIGDLSKLNAEERTRYYVQVCASLGLNPLTRPFEYIVMKGGKMVLYARRDATEQLRRIHNVSLQIVARERHEDVYIVTARASMPGGRTDESVGAVSLTGLKGEYLSNAIMTAETKSKRRVTLSIVGLGFLDESEVPSISTQEPPSAQTQLPAPAAERPRQIQATDEGMKMNAKQAEQIDNLLTELSVTDNDALCRRVKKLYDAEHVVDLSATQAADFIWRLEQAKAKKQTTSNP